MDALEALRDYPARAWHAGARLYLCLPCCDLFGHLLEGGNEALVPLEAGAPDPPCDIHLDPTRAPCSFDQAVGIPNPDGDAEGALWNAPVGEEPGARPVAVLEPRGSEDTVSKKQGDAKPTAIPIQPRWELIIQPAPNSEALVTIRVHAEDVTLGEVAHAWSKIGPHLTRGSSHQHLPTEAEVRAQAAAQDRAKRHPATRLWVQNGRHVWVGESAKAAGVWRDLSAAGWMDAGPVPDGVQKACEFALDEVAFRAKWLRAAVAGG